MTIHGASQLECLQVFLTNVIANRNQSQIGTHLKNSPLLPFPGFPRKLLITALAAVLALLPARAATAQKVDTAQLNRDPYVQEAFREYYNMDYDSALVKFQRIQAQHPNDPLATAFVLHVILFRELNRLDLLDTTFYANDGFLTGKHPVVEDPKVRAQIKSLSQKVYDQAAAELRSNPNDVDALFARGWARSLQATYLAMVERSFSSALHLALGAKDDHQRVLQLDPNYDDAKMVVGIYQYTVGALPFGFKLLFGFAGIHGSKSSGLALLRDAADHGTITSVEARTAMDLFLRREAKYQQAIVINKTLVSQYPHDFLFALERANLSKDAGQGTTAVNLYRDVINAAQHSGYYKNAHVELAYFGLGDSLRGQHQYPDAISAYQKGAFLPSTSPELKRRCLLAAGETYDLMHDSNQAHAEYQNVLANGANSAQGELARKYLKNPYHGR